jgi:hypothetical protein
MDVTFVTIRIFARSVRKIVIHRKNPTIDA